MSRHSLRACALAAFVACAFAACTPQAVRAPVPVDPAEAARQDAARAALADWSLSGRVAISGGRQGGSGRIDWTQQGGRYDITLSAPVTRQGWRLGGDARHARLDGIQGGAREGDDVEALLRDATGWDIPVRALVDWVRGVPADASAFGDPRMAYGAGQLPASLEQAGWRIDYREWHAAATDRPALPRRIEAQRGDARVRLVVDDWRARQASGEAQGDDGDDLASPDAQLAATLRTLRLDDPAADAREHIAAGDLRPVGVCGFACLAPGAGPAGAPGAHGVDLRIIDGTGDVIRDDRHLELKARAEAYARAYNAALAAWRQAHPEAGAPPPAR